MSDFILYPLFGTITFCSIFLFGQESQSISVAEKLFDYGALGILVIVLLTALYFRMKDQKEDKEKREKAYDELQRKYDDLVNSLLRDKK
ncbi:MAG: hypothetical protein FWD31_03760 [Planctomycetaceae bacterium]|nr:hypothetical protein [Planctomycetaceae bacterium]